MEKRHRNDGLRKVCGCSRRHWAKCEHSWRFNFRYRKGKHHRISLDHHAGKHLSKAEAKTLANDLRAAIQNGDYPPAAPTPAATPMEITFAKLGTLWMEREREERIADWKSDRSRLAGLGKLTARRRLHARRSPDRAHHRGRSRSRFPPARNQWHQPTDAEQVPANVLALATVGGEKGLSAPSVVRCREPPRATQQACEAGQEA